MIYVVEIPQEGRPFAWFAFDVEDLSRKVHAAKVNDPRTVYACLSPREQLAANGLEHSPEQPAVRSAAPEIFHLADSHGWDTPLYRADYLLAPELWQSEAVSELEACVAAVAEGKLHCRVYLSDQAAASALYQDPLYQGREGFYAHMALREQLIAMEAISDDL